VTESRLDRGWVFLCRHVFSIRQACVTPEVGQFTDLSRGRPINREGEAHSCRKALVPGILEKLGAQVHT
jgi:hypothetical protein